MGRAFEYRKERKFRRWAAMSKAFTKIGKEIAMAVRAGGPEPTTNSRLRIALQNAKGANMPKDSVEKAIKRAVSKEEGDYQELVYEGIGPNGVAIMVECATDNPVRTVANLRLYFSKSGGALGNSGSVDYMFDRKGVFRIPADQVNFEELELNLIDWGAEDIELDEGIITVYTKFTDFGMMQKALEENNVPVEASELQRIPTSNKELTDAQMDSVINLIEKLEDDDDVQQVFHNAI
jgi:YebC/PmpR family DNA-binding regulatory protein